MKVHIPGKDNPPLGGSNQGEQVKDRALRRKCPSLATAGGENQGPRSNILRLFYQSRGNADSFCNRKKKGDGGKPVEPAGPNLVQFPSDRGRISVDLREGGRCRYLSRERDLQMGPLEKKC